MNVINGGYGRPDRGTAPRGVHFEQALQGNPYEDSHDQWQTHSSFHQSEPRGRQCVSAEKMIADMDRYCPLLSVQEDAHVQRVIKEMSRIVQAALMRLGSNRSPEMQTLGCYAYGIMTSQDVLDVCAIVPTEFRMEKIVESLEEQLESRHEIRWVAPARPDCPFAAPGFLLKIEDGVRVKLLLTQRVEGLPPPSGEFSVPTTAGLMACEATKRILTSVPDIQQFRQLLRFVRFWARQRGIYGSHVSFLSGTSWAVLCAFVCQNAQCLDLPTSISAFFATLCRWDWTRPISLDQYQSQQVNQQPGLVILIPAGYGIPCTSMMPDTTVQITFKELTRVYKLTHQLEMGRSNWEDIYGMSKFFKRHRHYVQFNIMAKNEKVLARWLTWVEQKMSDVVTIFERTTKHLVTVRPWPDLLDYRDHQWPYSKAIFFGLHLDKGDGKEPAKNKSKCYDLREPIFKLMEQISTWPRAGVHANEFEFLVQHVRVDELSDWLERRQRNEILNTSSRMAISHLGGMDAGHVGQQNPMIMAGPEECEQVFDSL